MINIITKKYFIEISVQFEEEPLVAVEVGESSSSPQPLIVSEEINEFADSDMFDNDDLIAVPEFPKDQNGKQRPFTQLRSQLEILVTLG